MKVLPAILSALLLAACSAPGMPGYVDAHVSDFDGAKEITMQPGAIKGSGLRSPCALGAAWSTRAPNAVTIVVRLFDYTSIDSAAGLEFNIDGQILSLTSPQEYTAVQRTRGPGYAVFRTSDKRFPMTMVDFDRMLAASSVGVRVNALAGYVEGRLVDEPMSALRGFREFRAALPR